MLRNRVRTFIDSLTSSIYPFFLPYVAFYIFLISFYSYSIYLSIIENGVLFIKFTIFSCCCCCCCYFLVVVVEVVVGFITIVIYHDIDDALIFIYSCCCCCCCYCYCDIMICIHQYQYAK